MRIGLDYRPAMMATTGIGRYVAALSGELAGACDLRLFGVFRKGNRPEVRRAPAGAHLLAWPIPSRLFDLAGRAGLWPADRALGGCDLYHHTNYWLAEVGRGTRQVMTLHDLAHMRDPSCHTPRAVEALTAVVASAVRRCAAFLVPSEATARDCENYLGLSRDRIFVTPLGVEAGFASPSRCPSRRPSPGPSPYLLAVGTLEPRKNHLRLIEAYARLRTDVPLHLVGKRGWCCDDVIERARATPGVEWKGHLPEEGLRAELAGATALVYPSLLEGFGLPVLEAMAAGVPVITSDVEPLRSLGEGAALLVDPLDVDALADAMETMLEDGALRSELIERGLRRAADHTWAACADATRRAYEAVLA